jgi:histidine triad (HIT) family protein
MLDRMTADPDCLFCKIVAGEIPATVVHETDTTLAFRDLEPQAPTHVLVVPRSHYPNAAALAEGEPDTAAHLFETAHEIADSEGLDRGYRLVFNTGAEAHQTVFHVHMHLLGGRAMGWPPG